MNEYIYNNEIKQLLKKAKQGGLILNKKKMTFEKKHKKEDEILVLHVRGCNFGYGESMGDYELFDKIFKIEEDVLNAITEESDNEKTFELICEAIVDEDFFRSNMFENISFGDWKYKETKSDGNFENSTFEMMLRMTAYDSMMCEFLIYKISTESFYNYKNTCIVLKSPNKL